MDAGSLVNVLQRAGSLPEPVLGRVATQVLPRCWLGCAWGMVLPWPLRLPCLRLPSQPQLYPPGLAPLLLPPQPAELPPRLLLPFRSLQLQPMPTDGEP